MFICDFILYFFVFSDHDVKDNYSVLKNNNVLDSDRLGLVRSSVISISQIRTRN